jgi:hypothetical protein
MKRLEDKLAGWAPAHDKSADRFAAAVERLQQSSHHFDDTGGAIRPWKEMTAEGKLGYVLIEAIREGADAERIAQAAREIVGGDAEKREQVYLRMLLERERELLDLAELIPESNHDLFAPSRPLAPRMKELIGEPEEAGDQQREDNDVDLDW